MNEQTILNAINAKFKEPITVTHLRELFIDLKNTIQSTIVKKQTPIFRDVQLGNQPYVVDYMNRLHIFAFNPSNADITLTGNDGMTAVLPQQTWSNIGFRESTRLSAASGLILIKCTDEVVP